MKYTVKFKSELELEASSEREAAEKFFALSDAAIGAAVEEYSEITRTLCNAVGCNEPAGDRYFDGNALCDKHAAIADGASL